MQISVMLADDHQVVLEGLKALIAAEPDLKVVGEATDGLAVLPLVVELAPEVLVLDLMMPGMNGLEVARQIHARAPETRIVVLSMHESEVYVVEALRNGATGYVLKHAPGRELIEAIRAARGGKRYLSPPLSDEQLSRYEQSMSGA
ncbi:MAG: response regulator transcription factor, partial [Polyangia bacterium]